MTLTGPSYNLYKEADQGGPLGPDDIAFIYDLESQRANLVAVVSLPPYLAQHIRHTTNHKLISDTSAAADTTSHTMSKYRTPTQNYQTSGHTTELMSDIMRCKQ